MKSRFSIITALLVSTYFSCAQLPPSAESNPHADSAPSRIEPRSENSPLSLDRFIEASLFAPELIMQNQAALGLTTEQQASLRAQMQEVLPSFTELQWQQGAEIEAMATLLNAQKPDEGKVLAQLDKLLRIENDIKRLHTRLLIRIKSTLSIEQQAWLRAQSTRLSNIEKKSIQARTVTVIGKVNRGGAVEIPLGQKISILEAIARAGDFSPLANKNKIQLNSGGKITFYRFDELVKIKDPEKQVFVEPGDIIYVHESFF